MLIYNRICRGNTKKYSDNLGLKSKFVKWREKIYEAYFIYLKKRDSVTQM